MRLPETEEGRNWKYEGYMASVEHLHHYLNEGQHRVEMVRRIVETLHGEVDKCFDAGTLDGVEHDAIIEGLDGLRVRMGFQTLFHSHYEPPSANHTG